MKAVKIALALLLVYTAQASAQLQYSAPAVDAEGMGGIEASLPSDNAMAQLANPAQTGFFSLHGIASIAAYVPAYSSNYQVGNGINSQSMFSTAAEFGMNLQKYLHTPFKISAGIGYARTGSNASGGGEVFLYDQQNRADNLVIGLGFDDVVKVGVGVGFNWISSVNYFPPTSQASVVAHSYGAIVQLPILNIIDGNNEDGTAAGLRPSADLTFAYAMRNMSGLLYYNSNPVFTEMPFRQADLGLNFKFGMESSFDGQPWDIVSVTLAREADDPLWRTDSTLVVYTVGANRPDSTYIYINVPTNSPRYFNPYQNFILGNSLGKDGIRTGGQIQFAEFLYLRLGATAGPVIGGSTTYGFGFRLKGLLRLLAVVEHMPHPQGSVVSFLMNHVDLQYDFSRAYRGVYQGKPFEDLNLVVR